MSLNTTSHQPAPAAVILAAGMSSRCGRFKPLLPLGDETILERVIRIYRNAGISDIIVVTGYRSEDIIPLIERMHAGFVLNPRYDHGMFSSVTAGVSYLPDICPAFFIHPVDIPMVRPQTVICLQEAFARGGNGIYYPVVTGERGHPPLISGNYRKDLIAWNGSDGLRGFLSQYEPDARDVSVADRFIIQDIDSSEDYHRVLESLSRYDIPSEDECRTLMTGVSEDIRRHCDAVAIEAEHLGKSLNAAGCCLDISLIVAAARVHDIARAYPDHATVGAQILRRHGFGRVADIVALHMNFSAAEDAPITEAEVVYIADKQVQADRVTGVEARFESKLQRHAADPDICRYILKRRDHARKSLQRIETRIADFLRSRQG
jgi:CTP:molybdopterin cytidylyltransferase MocA